MAYNHWILGNYDSSFHLINLALSYLDSVGDSYERVTVYMHNARTCQEQFMELGDTALLDKTIQWLYKGLEVKDTSIYMIANLYYNLGSFYLLTGSEENILKST